MGQDARDELEKMHSASSEHSAKSLQGWSRRVQQLRQWMRDRNPHRDLGAGYFTLEFFDKRSEHGFATRSTPRLTRSAQTFGGMVLLVQLIWTFVFTIFGHGRQLQTIAQRRTWIGGLIVECVGMCVSCLLIVVSRVSIRMKWMGPRQLEIFVIACLSLFLLLMPFTQMQYMSRLINSDLGPETSQDKCEIWFLLAIDCIVTSANLMPIRWSSLCVLNILSIIWYPLVRGSVIGMQPDFCGITLMLGFLIACATVGKRSTETHERRSYKDFVHERTLRTQSEFELSLCAAGEQPATRARTNGSQSLLTEDIFQEGVAARGIESTLLHVGAAAEKEQWLIQPEEVSVCISHVLGEGGNGAVAEGSMGGVPVAVKFSVRGLSDEDVGPLVGLIAELRVLRKVRHPNIVMFYGAIIDPIVCEMSLVLELVAGPNLYDFVLDTYTRGDRLADWAAFRLAVGTGNAVGYLHGHRRVIVHGDLTPSNLLVEIIGNMLPRAKLADFGLSRLLSSKAQNLRGTLKWMAPELMERIEPNTAADVYGFGLVVQFMVSGVQPFSGKSRQEVKAALRARRLPTLELPAFSSELTVAVWSVSEVCVLSSPSSRASMDQVCGQLRGLRNLPRYSQAFGDGSVVCDLWGSFVGAGADGIHPTSMGQWSEAVRHFRERQKSEAGLPSRALVAGGSHRNTLLTGVEDKAEGGAFGVLEQEVGTEAPAETTAKPAGVTALKNLVSPPIGEVPEHGSSSLLEVVEGHAAPLVSCSCDCKGASGAEVGGLGVHGGRGVGDDGARANAANDTASLDMHIFSAQDHKDPGVLEKEPTVDADPAALLRL